MELIHVEQIASTSRHSSDESLLLGNVGKEDEEEEVSIQIKITVATQCRNRYFFIIDRGKCMLVLTVRHLAHLRNRLFSLSSRSSSNVVSKNKVGRCNS